MKTRVAPGQGSRRAADQPPRGHSHRVRDLGLPSRELLADTAQLAADETEHWAAAKRVSRKEQGSKPSTVASFPSIFASPLSVTRSKRPLVAIWRRP